MMKKATVYKGEVIASSINDVGTTGQLHAKESNWTILYTMHKYKFKMEK